MLKKILLIIQKKILDYGYSGVSDHKDTELLRKVFLINLFGLVGITFLGLLGIVALFQHNYLLSASLLAVTLLYYLNHFILKKTLNYNLASKIILYPLGLLFVYLVYTGGVNNTGIIWIFLYPSVVLFLSGFKRGLIHIFFFLLTVLFVLFFSDTINSTAVYSAELASRSVYAFIVVSFLAAFHEYSRMHASEKMQLYRDELELAVRQDVLTKLNNRRGIYEKLEQERTRTKRNKHSYSVMICDIDHFKLINDKFGHEAGDIVLKKIADRFKETIREQDVVARWGGEEFLFLFPDTDFKGAYIISEKIRKHIEKHDIIWQKYSISVTISLGIFEVDQTNHIDISIKQADEFLYMAKSQGRNKTLPKSRTMSLSEN